MSQVSTEFLPFALPSVDEAEIEEVVATLRSGWWTTGERTKRFERDFAAYVGTPHALAVSSATAGLHLALEAVGVQSGDRVVTTPFTFTATAEVIVHLGAEPVFVDVEPDFITLDPEELEATLARVGPVKAVVPVHFAGHPSLMEPIMASCARHGARVVEDAAHALPASCAGEAVGTMGDATVFSFYATKTLATGEGGMVTTADDAIADRIRLMRLHGISKDVFDRYTSPQASWFYDVIAPGFKYNLPDIASAIGIHQLARCDAFRDRRQAIARRYSRAFRDLPVRVPEERAGDAHAWHLYVLRLDLDALTIDRDTFIERMRDRGVGTSVHFRPLHLHSYWRDRYGHEPGDFPRALDAYTRVVSLPIYPAMTDDQVERVVEAVTAVLCEAAV